MRAERLIAVFVPPATLGLALAISCTAAKAPEPPYGDNPTEIGEGACVPYPPPAAHAEELPARPDEHAVWIDGHWRWEERRWIWRAGKWEDPPAGSVYARPRLERQPNGALAYFPGRWVDRVRKGAKAPNPITMTTCPEPPRPIQIPLPDASASAFVGPALVYLADAPSSAPPKVQPDAVIPRLSDAEEPEIIQPPD